MDEINEIGGSRSFRRARLVLVLFLCAAMPLVACQELPVPILQKSAGWQEISLPSPGAQILEFMPIGDGMLALGSVPASDGRAPAAWTTTDAVLWHPISLSVATGYGAQAQFVMGAVAGDRISALGQAYGGAHSNPRPTLWSGTARGLTEYEQPYTLLGGGEAIGQSAESATDAIFVIVGSWAPTGERYGAASWTSADGAHWTRYSSPLGMASGSGEQTSALGVTVSSRGFLATGQTITGAGIVPLSWTSADGIDWRREILPSTGSGASAAIPACYRGECDILGNSTSVPGNLLCWNVPSNSSPSLGSPGPAGSLIQPLQVYRNSSKAFVLANIDGPARFMSVSDNCSRWNEIEMPVPSTRAAFGLLGHFIVLATNGTTSSQLWTRPTQ